MASSIPENPPRTQAAALTHFAFHDTIRGREAYTLCGIWIPKDARVSEPTCPVCQAEYARLDALEF